MREYYALPFFVAATASMMVWAGCGGDGEASVDPASENDGGASSIKADSSTETDSSSSSGSDAGAVDGGPTTTGPLGGDGGIDPPDARPGGDTTQIACGATSCALATDTCCVGEVNGGDNGYSCVPTTDAGCPEPAGGGDVASLRCSAQANCPTNTVCCVRETNNGAASECKATCAGNEAQLCDVNATSTGCATTSACSNDNIDDWGNLPDSYATCGGEGN